MQGWSPCCRVAWYGPVLDSVLAWVPMLADPVGWDPADGQHGGLSYWEQSFAALCVRLLVLAWLLRGSCTPCPCELADKRAYEHSCTSRMWRPGIVHSPLACSLISVRLVVMLAVHLRQGRRAGLCACVAFAVSLSPSSTVIRHVHELSITAV